MSTTDPVRAPQPSLKTLLAAFAAIYIVWGSTFVAVKFAVATIPPVLMIGVRSISAGIILSIIGRASGAIQGPVLNGNWLIGALTGCLLFAVGHSLLAWSEQTVASGHAAVLIALLPLIMPFATWSLGVEPRPQTRGLIGLFIGLGGVLLLTLSRGGDNGAAINPYGVAALVISSIGWAFGTAIARRWRIASSPFSAASIQLIAGGIITLIVSGLIGEWRGFRLGMISQNSWFGLIYLIIFGSVVAYSAYAWLIQVYPPTKVSTYAYVNPVIALLLGGMVFGEPLGWREIVSTAIILSGVALVMLPRRRRAENKI